MAEFVRNALHKGKEYTRNALADVKARPRNAMLDFARGAGMGLSTDILGYPVDVATMAMRPFGYNVEQPVGGSEWLANKLTSPTGAPAEMAGRVATGMLTPGPDDMLRLAGYLPKKAPVNELITYHGSPHRINNVTPDAPMGRFDLSKVGTGEGAQAYGHGIYLAETPSVAKTYMASDLNGSAWMQNGKGVKSGALHEALKKWANPDEGSVQPAIDRIKEAFRTRPYLDYPEHVGTREAMQAQLALLEKNAGKLQANKGHFYTVDLPDEHIANMLDWDAPLSQQPEAVRKALKSYAVADDASITGGEFYRKLTQEMGAEPEEISAALRAAGIPGIRYLDGNSRTTSFGPRDSGTRNFVIFDGDTAKILNRE
jgi:hypothetical protein